MASRPKEMRLKKKLAEIAKREGLASPIEWIVSQIASGVTVTQMAKDVAAMELDEHRSEVFSRNWYSMIVNRLPVQEGERPAKEQIAAARREAAYVLLDHALEISDEPAHDSASVQRNRLRSDVRLRMAALWNREELGDRAGVAVHLDLGALHIEALRQRQCEMMTAYSQPVLQSGEADYEAEGGGAG